MSERNFPNVKASSVAIIDKENGYTNYRIGFNTEEAQQLLAQLQEALAADQSTGAMFQFSYGKTGAQKYMNGDAYFRVKLPRKDVGGGARVTPRSGTTSAGNGAKPYAARRFQG